ncbi:hypothetical protein MKW94_009922 [Papaver nudicaule]|uniref:Uncharacterized protein n=1 Tax=Papaver nudicaule TaxID=74823 RepID=A0AA41RVS0_PAPNU|nr:hypothetical protein [Papaver nudicaule]
MAMMMAWKKQLVSSNQTLKVGTPEFLHRIGKGVETHVDKIEAEIGDFHKLPVTPNRNSLDLHYHLRALLTRNPRFEIWRKRRFLYSRGLKRMLKR